MLALVRSLQIKSLGFGKYDHLVLSPIHLSMGAEISFVAHENHALTEELDPIPGAIFRNLRVYSDNLPE